MRPICSTRTPTRYPRAPCAGDCGCSCAPFAARVPPTRCPRAPRAGDVCLFMRSICIARIQRGIGLNPSIVRLNFGIYVSILLLFAFAVSLFFVTVSRYSEVLEMAQEIGILRVLGASEGYLLGLLCQETLLLTALGTIAGIMMTYGMKWFVGVEFSKYLTLETVYEWWPIAGAISAASSLSGAALALRRSIRNGVIQALSADE
jgi:putative ABC transport system permease protein